MARFLPGEPSLPLQQPPLWSVNCSQNVYQNRQDNSGAPTHEGKVCLRIPGWLAVDSPVKRRAPERGKGDNPASYLLGPDHQREEIKSHPISADIKLFLGATVDFAKGNAFLTPERVADIVSCALRLLRREKAPASVWMCLLGIIASLTAVLPQCLMRMRVIQLHVLLQFNLRHHSHDKADSLLKHSPQGPHMVDKTRRHQPRQTFQIGNIFLYPDNRRIQDRVGSTLQGHPALGNVVSKHSKTPHQHSRAVGNPPRSEETLTETTEQDGNSRLRQYVGGLLHQQGRWNQEQISLPPNCEAVEMVSLSPHHAPHHSSPGRGQCPSGLPVQEDLRGKGPSKKQDRQWNGTWTQSSARQFSTK